MIEMVKRFKKRVRKLRGSQHHGWGKQKGHKKSGIRGGVGKAGPKTRHKMRVIRGLQTIGKHGFTRPPVVVKGVKQINVSHIEAMLPSLVKKGLVEKSGDKYNVNLTDLGYSKLLAQGKVTLPLIITVDAASEKAIEKIEEAGGQVNLLQED